MHFRKCLNFLLHLLLVSSTVLASTVEEAYLKIAKAEFIQKKGEQHLTQLRKLGPKLTGASQMADKLRTPLKIFKSVLNDVKAFKVKDRMAMQKPDQVFTDIPVMRKVILLPTLLHYETPNWFNIHARGQLYKSMIDKLKNPIPGEDNSQLVAGAERALEAFFAKTKELGIGKNEGVKLSWSQHSDLKSRVNKVKAEIARLPTYHQVLSKDFTLPEPSKDDGIFKRNPKISTGLVSGAILAGGLGGAYLTNLLAEFIRGKNGGSDLNEASQSPFNLGPATQSDMFSGHEKNPVIGTHSTTTLWSIIGVISMCVFLLIVLLFAGVFCAKKDNNKLGRAWKKLKTEARKRAKSMKKASSTKEKTRRSEQTKKKSSETKKDSETMKKQTSPSSTTKTTDQN